MNSIKKNVLNLRLKQVLIRKRSLNVNLCLTGFYILVFTVVQKLKLAEHEGTLA